MTDSVTRRRFAGIAVTATVGLLAGCEQPGQDGNETSPTDDMDDEDDLGASPTPADESPATPAEPGMAGDANETTTGEAQMDDENETMNGTDNRTMTDFFEGTDNEIGAGEITTTENGGQ